MIYFAQAGEGPIKIGSSKNPEQRLAGLGGASHAPLRLLATMPGGLPDEFALHKRFAAHRIKGEWFHPAAELLAYIKGIMPTPAERRATTGIVVGDDRLDDAPVADGVTIGDFALQYGFIWRRAGTGRDPWVKANLRECAAFAALVMFAVRDSCAGLAHAYRGCRLSCRLAIGDMLRSREPKGNPEAIRASQASAAYATPKPPGGTNEHGHGRRLHSRLRRCHQAGRGEAAQG